MIPNFSLASYGQVQAKEKILAPEPKAQERPAAPTQAPAQEGGVETGKHKKKTVKCTVS